MERSKALIKSGVDAIVIDTAHGHTERVVSLLKNLKDIDNNPDIVVGNIATAEAAKFLLKAGADGIKVGIGPGSICTTRIVAGVGVPQFSAILDVCNSIQNKVPRNINLNFFHFYANIFRRHMNQITNPVFYNTLNKVPIKSI